MLGTAVIIASTAIIFWYFFIRSLSFWTRQGVKQGKPWIIFGDTWETFLKRSSFNDFLYKVYNMHPGTRYSGMYNFNRPVLVLKDPELIKQVGVKDFENFTDRPPLVDPDADPLWSNALLNLRGERWRQLRTTLTPTFTSSKIKGIYALMLETSQSFVKYLSDKEDKIIEVEMKDACSRFANDVIATTAFGVKVNSLEVKTNTFYKMGKRLTEFTDPMVFAKFIGHQLFPKLFKYLGITLLDKTASNYFYNVIDETIKAREEQNIIRPDMIQLLLEARKDKVLASDTGKSKSGVKVSNKEIASQAMIFFFAGFDTVSTVMSCATYELALNKDIQDRLREEINEIQENGNVAYDDLMQMKYMDMVVSEVMRKWPALPALDRICTKPYTIEPLNSDEQPLKIKINQELIIPVYGIHRDPKWFPNPDKFDPERFSDDNKGDIVPYSYMPFGVGPRLCIGNRFALVEIKAMLFYLLLNYEIVPIQRTPIPLVLANDFSQMPEKGFWLGFKHIK